MRTLEDVDERTERNCADVGCVALRHSHSGPLESTGVIIPSEASCLDAGMPCKPEAPPRRRRDRFSRLALALCALLV